MNKKTLTKVCRFAFDWALVSFSNCIVSFFLSWLLQDRINPTVLVAFAVMWGGIALTSYAVSVYADKQLKAYRRRARRHIDDAEKVITPIEEPTDEIVEDKVKGFGYRVFTDENSRG